jgi:FkbM family methyltransferase
MPGPKPYIPWSLRLYCALMNRAPVAGGLTRLSFNRLINAAFLRLGPGPVVATMRNGIRIEVDPNDYHGRVLCVCGTNDIKVQVLCQALLRPNDRFLDIGANYSSIGLQVADVVGAGGAVHLFEPQAHLCERVQAAVDAAGLSNVFLHRVALMDHKGEMILAMPTHHSGRATLVDHPERESWTTMSVPVEDIGACLPPLIGEAPFGVKLDVEGAEPMLLPWLLRQPNLRFLVLEAAFNREQLWDLIQGAKLVLYGLKPRLFVREVRRIPGLEQLRDYHDVVVVRPEAGGQLPERATMSAFGRLVRRQA